MLKISLFSFLFLFSFIQPLFAQEDPLADQYEGLQQRQENLREQYQDLVLRMRLNAADPNLTEEKRTRLSRAVQLMDQYALEIEMQNLEQLIQQKSLSSAVAKANNIVSKIQKILMVLDGYEEYTTDPKIPSLTEQLKQLQSLLDQQKELKQIPLENSIKAQRQKDLAEKTEQLLQQLTEPKAQQPLQEALDAMRQAEEKLQQKENAELQQEQAEQKLQETKEQLEKKLNQYKNIQNEKLLLHVEQELTILREKQAQLNLRTAEITPTTTRRELRNFVSEQNTLRQNALDLSKKLLEGNVPIFGNILQGISQDMHRVGESLKEQDLSEYTKDLQQEIIIRLDDLLDALRKEQQRRQNKGEDPAQQQDQNGQSEPRLVPLPAELTMLLKRQEYLRMKHENFRAKFPDLENRAEMTDAQRRIYERLAAEQNENSNYLEALRKALFDPK